PPRRPLRLRGHPRLGADPRRGRLLLPRDRALRRPGDVLAPPAGDPPGGGAVHDGGGPPATRAPATHRGSALLHHDHLPPPPPPHPPPPPPPPSPRPGAWALPWGRTPRAAPAPPPVSPSDITRLKRPASARSWKALAMSDWWKLTSTRPRRRGRGGSATTAAMVRGPQRSATGRAGGASEVATGERVVVDRSGAASSTEV